MDRNRLGGVWIAILVAGLALAGCKDRDEDAPPAAAETTAPLPALPAWAQPLQGKAVNDFKSSTDCLGAFDAVDVRHTGAASGVEVEGWAWLKGAKAAPEHVLFADAGGGIVGAAETSKDRPDVPKALPEVVSSKVGWRGGVTRGTGNIRAFAVLPDQALCKIGVKDVAH